MYGNYLYIVGHHFLLIFCNIIKIGKVDESVRWFCLEGKQCRLGSDCSCFIRVSTVCIDALVPVFTITAILCKLQGNLWQCMSFWHLCLMIHYVSYHFDNYCIQFAVYSLIYGLESKLWHTKWKNKIQGLENACCINILSVFQTTRSILIWTNLLAICQRAQKLIDRFASYLKMGFRITSW